MTPPTLDELMKLAAIASIDIWNTDPSWNLLKFQRAASPNTVLKILRDYKRMREALEPIVALWFDPSSNPNMCCQGCDLYPLGKPVRHEHDCNIQRAYDCIASLELGKG